MNNNVLKTQNPNLGSHSSSLSNEKKSKNKNVDVAINKDSQKVSSKKSEGVAKKKQKEEQLTWEDFDLKETVQRGVYSYGWDAPSGIQNKVIPHFIKGKDLIGQAESGKGKTGSFVVSSLQIIDTEVKNAQILVLSPTRELAYQSCTVATALGAFMENLRTCLLVGGTNVREDIRVLRTNPQLICGTPGRVEQHLRNGHFDAGNLLTLVIDEADEMLSTGFLPQLEDIFQYMPHDVQVCLFSATMKDNTVKMCSSFLRDPVKILMPAETLSLKGISQFYIGSEQDRYKFDILLELYNSMSVPQVVIFCNSKRRVEILADRLEANDFTVSFTHGGMSSNERIARLKKFKASLSRVLIATDVMARGIDASGVAVVINYDFPTDREMYLHRIGRSGRYGKKGVAINFVNDDREEVMRFHDVKKHFGATIEELPSDLANVFKF